MNNMKPLTQEILVRLVKEMEFILEWHRIETIPLREQEISRIEALVLEGKNLLEG
jgi:hypothetical protein